jgi:hypothetical protein
MSTLPSQIAADPTAAARAQRSLAAFRTGHLPRSDFAPVAVVIGAAVRLQ